MMQISSAGLSVTGNIGFYGTAAQAKPTVTGSRGANAALTSLCTALATLGLITNSTS
jgi:Na+/glutamate symporter